MSDLSRLREAARVPDHSILLFGANPCHSPAREPRSQADCPRCAALAGTDHDPVRDVECCVDSYGNMTGEPATFVCCCGRSVYDGTPALARAVKRRLEDDPESGTDRTDAGNRTAEAVNKGAGGKKARGRVEYPDKAIYSDYLARLRARRKVPK